MASYIKAAGSTVDKLMGWAGEIRKDPDATEQAIRFVGFSALAASAVSGVSTPLLSNLSGRLLENADLINCFQLAPGVYDIANGKYQEKSILQKLASATFTSIAVGSVTLMLDSWKFIDLTQIAASIGNKISLLKPVTQLGAGVVIRSQLVFAFACLNIYNIKKLAEGGNNEVQKRQLMIDVAQLTSQVAVNTLIVTGAVATSPAVIALGVTAFGLGVVSFVHKIACKEKSDKESTIDESNIRLYTPPEKSGYKHCVDFAKRISTSFTGIDYTCKFGVAGVALFGLFAPVTAPFAAASRTLSAMVDLGKLTALADRVHKLGKQIAKKECSFQGTVSLVCLTTVSAFESLSWLWGMKDLEKAGSVFKTWRNGFFVAGLTAGIVDDSHTIDGFDGKMKKAEEKRDKWKKREDDTLQVIKERYQGKIDSITSDSKDEEKAKVAKWTEKLAATDNDGYLGKYKVHLAKKQEDWKYIKEYRVAQKEDMESRRVGASTKIFSLVVDLGVVCMTVCSVSSMIIPVIGVQFAALTRAKQIFTVANFALAYINFSVFHNSEYNVKDRYNYLVDQRGISSSKLA